MVAAIDKPYKMSRTSHLRLFPRAFVNKEDIEMVDARKKRDYDGPVNMLIICIYFCILVIIVNVDCWNLVGVDEETVEDNSSRMTNFCVRSFTGCFFYPDFI